MAENANKKTNVLAVLSLIFALLGVLTTWFIPLVSQLIAIICGHVARSQIKKNQDTQEGDGLALAGLIIAYLMFVIGLIPLVFLGGLAVLFATA